MAVTYILRDTASDLTGGADFNLSLTSGAPGTSSPVTISLANGAGQEISFAWTPPGIPGVNGATGDYTVEMNVTVANADVDLSATLHRVNSVGTVQASSGTAAAQSAGSTGVKTFSFTGVDLGTWAAGDRLRVDYRFINNAAHGGQSFDLDRNTANAEVTTPFAVGGTNHTETPTDQAGLGDSHSAGIVKVVTQTDGLALTDEHDTTLAEPPFRRVIHVRIG